MRAGTASPALVGILVFAYFVGWAALRPPLQTPDEPQHLMRATSILRQPWIGDPRRFPLDPAHLNPLAFDTPVPIDQLFFKRFNALTTGDIARVRRTPWPDYTVPLPPYERAIASYPTLFYGTLFVLAEPVVRLADLSPWDATYAYRFATAALAAALWAAVWHALRRQPDLTDWTRPLFAFTVLNPMLAFISSGVNPDAVNIPLCTLALLATWHALRRGRGWAIPLAIWLLAAMLTKPAGLQMAATLAVVVTSGALVRVVERPRAIRILVVLAATTVLAVASFYAWSPPRFLAGGPSSDTLSQYLLARWNELPAMWRMYWGQLGWLDYWTAPIWYQALAALTVVNLGCVLWRPATAPTVISYLGLVWLTFAAATFVGEFRYLPEAGYTFQGRYLLPAAMGLGAVLLHRVRAARIAILIAIVGLNVALARETVRRYYVSGWSGAVHALPFHGAR